MTAEIVCLGEPMFELSEVEQDASSHYLPGFGGDVSNAAVAAARQGASVAVATRLGDDAFGDRFIELWEREGIDVESVDRDRDAPTGIYLISYDGDGHKFTYFREGSAASRMSPKNLPEEAIARARILHLSAISQAISPSACDAAFMAMEIAQENGVQISYDTNLRLKLWPLPRARAIIAASVAMSDYCLPSLEDGRQLTDLHDPEEIAMEFREIGARNVLLKLGSEGVLVAGEDQDEPVMLPGFQVEAVDATGAGDCFDGAFLARMNDGDPLLNAVVYANAAAALSTRGYGAVTPLPSRSEVEAFIEERGNPID